MNPFQRAREEAVALRAKLLGERAGEIVHVREFLTPEPIGTMLPLGIAYVPKGALDLGDADAVLRRSEDYIYVRDDVSEAERAYLVAHELGHYVLDEALEDVTVASLKALSGAEGAPAVIKVEAYGARERQELRANVFARELQLPRQVAAQLYADGVGPRQIAKDYGVHLEVARQQMLDAALLPDVDSTQQPKMLHPPSGDQLLAIKAPERFANVVAGPGSGKTSTLVHRVQYLIEKLGVDPAHILVLTFTNKAAFELVERLRDAGIAHAADVWAGTFHAFGLEFLRKYHQCFDLEPDLVVADKLNAITLLNRELPKLTLKHYQRIQDPYEWLPAVVNGIKRLKEEMVTPQQYCSAIVNLDAPEALKLRREDVAMLYECHERVLRESRMVDFVDLVTKPAKALEEDRPRYGELADKFQYVLVDEYQDVTYAMVQLIRQIAKNAKSLWVVGDVRQAIHHWRGASVQSLTRFDQIFRAEPGGTRIRTYPLQFNRRSSPEILELVKQVGRRHVLESTPLLLAETTATSAATGLLPTLVRCAPEAAMPQAVASAIEQLHSGGIHYGQQAVLSRGNHEIERLAEGLRAAGLPVLHIGELAQRSEVKKLLCLMQLLVERLPRALVGLMGDPMLSIDQQDLKTLLNACETDPLLQRGAWRNDALAGLSPASQAALDNVRSLLSGQRRQSSPWSFVCDMLLERRYGYPEKSNQSTEAHAVRIALWQFAYATRAGDGEAKIPTLPRFLLRQQLRQRIGETYSERELPAEAAALDAVHLLTVHGSKGLEFEAVHVSNVNIDDYGPDRATWRGLPDILEIVPPEVLGNDMDGWEFESAVERNNLLYVAASRARMQLFLYESGEDATKRTPQLAQPPTPYKVVSFSGAISPTEPTGPSSTTAGSIGAMPFDEFEMYARCPLQHWYRHTLELPGEQQLDIAIRARLSLMAALKAYAIGYPKVSMRDAFASEWKSRKLPVKAEDPQLWAHAVAVFKLGVEIVKVSPGVYAEPETVVDGFAIRLPWVLLDSSPRRPSMEYIRCASGDLDAASRLWRPMLNGLRPTNAGELVMHSLMAKTRVVSQPSGRISSTKAYITVQKYRAGNREPTTGRHCGWCTYSTLCPTKPLP